MHRDLCFSCEPEGGAPAGKDQTREVVQSHTKCVQGQSSFQVLGMEGGAAGGSVARFCAADRFAVPAPTQARVSSP